MVNMYFYIYTYNYTYYRTDITKVHGIWKPTDITQGVEATLYSYQCIYCIWICWGLRDLIQFIFLQKPRPSLAAKMTPRPLPYIRHLGWCSSKVKTTSHLERSHGGQVCARKGPTVKVVTSMRWMVSIDVSFVATSCLVSCSAKSVGLNSSTGHYKVILV